MARTLIGLKIRDRRKSLGITQAALAARLGISASYLNLIEGNRRNIGGALLKRAADALGLPIDQFDGRDERRLIDDLGEIAAAPLLGALQLDAASAADLAATHPGWARALVALHRSGIDREQTVIALSDRLSQDPFLADAVHGLLSSLSAIRSASEILHSVDELGAERRKRFVSIIAADSRRLSDVAQALAAFLGKAHTATRSITPAEQVDDFLFDHDNHFPLLESAAGELRAALGGAAGDVEAALQAWLKREHGVGVQTVAARHIELAAMRNQAHFDRQGGVLSLLDVASAPTRRFQLARLAAELACGEPIATLTQPSALLDAPAAKRRAERALSSYVAGALLMPYDDLREAALATRYDIDALCRRFGASFEQVCHRLVSLRRPGAEGIRFAFMRADAAGCVTKRFALPRLPLPRYGNACPLWAIYEAFQSPGSTVRQLAQFAGGDRYLFVARTIEKERPALHMPRRLLSIMLACDAVRAGELVYGDGLDLSPAAPATPVGQNCRVCVRRDCAYREEDPIIDAGKH